MPSKPFILPPGVAKALQEARSVCVGAVENDEDEERESYQAALEVDEAEAVARQTEELDEPYVFLSDHSMTG